jgi:hypothetical protein
MTFEQVLKPRGQRNLATLAWMPSAGNSGIFEGAPGAEVLQAAEINYRWTAVRWRTSGAGTGCILLYNCAEVPIRAAVDYIVTIASNSWNAKHSVM